MDKVKKFLEAHVQWVAVGLAAAFLGWMVYSYVILKPVVSSVGPNNPAAEPGLVAKIIADDVASPLKGQLESKSSIPAMGPTTDYANAVATMFEDPVGKVAIMPVPYTPVPGLTGDEGPTGPSSVHAGAKITRLPEPAPKLVDLHVSGGHSNVPAPIPTVAAGAQPPQANTQPAIDINWRTVEGTLHTAQLAKLFKDVGIAPGSPFSNTTVLRVELVRQEKQIDGSWGPETIVPGLDINPIDPLPPIDAAFQMQKDYVDYAGKNVVPIVQPAFYQVLQGDKWFEPGTPSPNIPAVTVDDTFDPKNPGAYTGDVTRLLPSEQKLVEDAKAAAAKRDALRQKNQNSNQNQNRNPGAPPGFPGPGGGGGGGGFPGGGGRGGPDAMDPDRPADGDNGLLLAQAAPPGFPGMPPGFPGPPHGYGGPPNGYGGPPTGQGYPPAAQPEQPNNLPAGSFDPSQQLDFKMWAHDVTVQAGKTYRYKLRYVLSNPVARTNGLCDPQKLAQQFFIKSTDSDWTEPVNVESDTNFFAVKIEHGIQFDVFKWKDGVWQMETVHDNPGDMVGNVDSTSRVDFTTGWTLVDVREDPANNDNRVLVLVSDNGTVIKKELITDAHSPGYRQLFLQVLEHKPAAAEAPPAPKGQLPPPIQ